MISAQKGREKGAHVLAWSCTIGASLVLPSHLLGYALAVASPISCLGMPNRARPSKKVGKSKYLGLGKSKYLCPTSLGTSVASLSQP